MHHTNRNVRLIITGSTNMIKSILFFGFIWLALPADKKKTADIQFLLIFTLFFLLFLLSFAIVVTPGFNVDGKI